MADSMHWSAYRFYRRKRCPKCGVIVWDNEEKCFNCGVKLKSYESG